VTDRRWQTVLHHVGTLLDAETLDGELVRRFLTDRDEAAFAALVERHGAMVLAACRRALRDEHDAEDVCQATFLVLARSAGTVRQRSSLASWLHGVALRLARKLKRSDARRRARDARTPPPEPTEPDAEVSWREVQTVLDEELARLPEKFREPLLLCYLEGRSRDEVATRLGVPSTTLRGRLEQGRERLRAGLARRGVTLSAALVLPVLLETRARAALPPALAVTTTRMATAFAVGPPPPSASRATVLAQEGMKTVLVPKLVTGAAVVLALALFGVCAALATRPGAGGSSPPAQEEPKVAARTADDPLPPGAVARFGTTKLRTTATVLHVSPDGKTLRTSAGARTIGRWDPDTGQLLDEVHLNAPTGERCWFSPDGRLVAVPDPKGIGLYDSQTGERKRTIAVEDGSHMTLAAFSPDGRTLATAEYDRTGRVRIWPVADGRSTLLAELPSYVNGLTFSPDGSKLYAAVDNHSVRCWDVSTTKEVWKNAHWARYLAVSPDGKTLATDTYQDGPLRLWNAETGRAVALLDSGKRSWSHQVAFSPDGRVIAFGTNDSVQLWDTKTHKLLRQIKGAGPEFAFSPDSATLYTLGPLLERWDVRTGKALYPDVRAEGHVGPVTAVAFAPGGRSLATVGADGTLRVWDRETGAHKVLPDRTRATPPLAYTPDGQILVGGPASEVLGVVRSSRVLSLIEADTGQEVRQFVLPQQPEHATAIRSARVTADGRTLMALGTTQARVLSSTIIMEQSEPVRAWDVKTGKVLLEKTILCNPSGPAAFSPSGRIVIRPGYREMLDVWTGRRREFNPARASLPWGQTFSPDGRWVTTLEPGDETNWLSPKAILVHETSTGRQVSRLAGALATAPALEFSPDGRLIAAHGTETLSIWDVVTGRRLLTIPVRGRVPHWTGWKFGECLAFAPDGRTLATGHADGTVLVWDLAPAWKALSPPKGPVDAAACWKELLEPGAKVGWLAVERLASEPTAAVRLLRDHLRPVTVEAKWVAERVAELSSDEFKTREAAATELKRVVDVVEATLVDARRTAGSPETCRRLDEILATVRPAVVPPEVVRTLRAVAVLERIGSPDAREILKTLSGGASGAELTREAKSALERLDHRASVGGK
jgi:RNA polymerase sigma factor (sigma-70 family)